MWRTDEYDSLGIWNLHILSWEECGYTVPCVNDISCNDGICNAGRCECPSSTWGARCQRGCVANVQVELTDNFGVVKSDRLAANQTDSFYSKDTHCIWRISPVNIGDYINISFDWIDIGEGDKVEIWLGDRIDTAQLDTAIETTKLYDQTDSVIIIFVTDYTNGGQGFCITYSTGDYPRNLFFKKPIFGINIFYKKAKSKLWAIITGSTLGSFTLISIIVCAIIGFIW